MSFDSKNFDPEFEKAIIEMLDEDGPVLPITQMGEPVLRAQTVPYDGQLSRKTLDRLVEAMRETMYKAPGVGLAGPQIGLNLSIAVLEDHVRSSSGGWADEDERAEASAAAIKRPASMRVVCLLKDIRRFANAGLILTRLGRMRTGGFIPNICTAGLHAFFSMKPIIFRAKSTLTRLKFEA